MIPIANEAEGVRAGRGAWGALAALMLGYAGLFAAYYPAVPGVEDETGFLNQALVWSRGAVSSEGAGLRHGLHDFIEVNGRHVPARHPGRSLLALPLLALGGVRATFVSGLALHLVMTAAGAALLARLGRSPLWAVLLLFHPTLAIYSRTITADGASGTGLLLAGLAVVAGSPVGAGLAVGLAAAMRYHAAMALPLVAGSFVYPRGPGGGRARPWRDAALCLLAGAGAGGVLVAYNLAVYGTPTEPFTVKQRGYFAPRFFAPYAAFYAAALMAVWPGMLLAPLLDRSRLRWLVRGLIVIFLGPLLFYYFHDTAPRRLEAWIVGQRLVQVALPLWVVSYAGVLDDWVAAPLRRLLGARAWGAVVALACLGLLAANGFGFSRHQRHLEALRQARDAVVARVPPDALILYNGSFNKIVGTPVDVPAYRLRPLESNGDPVDEPDVLRRDLDREPRPWYFALLRRDGAEPLTEYARQIIARYRLEPVPLDTPLLTLYVARPDGGPAP